MNRWIKKGAAVLLCVGLLAGTAFPCRVEAVTSESIKQKESQISDAQKEKSNLQQGLSNVKKLKEELETKKGNLEEYITALDGKLSKMTEKILGLKDQITAKEEEIAVAEAELAEAVRVEQEQYESMKNRIQFIYETGDNYIWDVIMSSDSFGDVLNKADYVESLYAYDRHMWEEYQATREYIDLCKQQLEVENEILGEQKAAVEQEQANMETLIQTKAKEVKATSKDIANQESAIAEYEAEIREQNELIAALEAQVAAEKKRLLAANASVIKYDGGVFKFPMASYTRVSDDYGKRIHPILQVERFHNGVDFAAPAGTAILAAYDGIVAAASYSTTMGNYVMIDHGDGLYTIYMHASAVYVTAGTAVSKGQTIAAVGSTGRSTGNHLHFGVRLNGAYVSPWNYLSA